jgi:hypothetical protein
MVTRRISVIKIGFLVLFLSAMGVIGEQLVVMDYLNAKLVWMTPDGSPIKSKRVERSFRMVADQQGFLFLQNLQKQILRLSPAGTTLKRFQHPTRIGPEQISHMACNHEGDLFVVNPSLGILEKYSARTGYAGAASMTVIGRAPSMTSDRHGNLYVGAIGGVRKFSPSGQDLGIHGSVTIIPNAMAVDYDGNLYVGLSPQIRKYGPTGAYIGVFANPTRMSYRILVDRRGTVYSCNPDGFVQRFSPTGQDLGTFGPVGGGVLDDFALVPGFAEESGSYQGLFADRNGSFTITLSSRGSWSAVIVRQGGRTFRVRGSFDVNGQYRANVGRNGPLLVLAAKGISKSSGGYRIDGTFDGVSVEVHQAAYARSVMPPEAGRYTSFFEPPPGGAFGSGWAQHIVARSGIVRTNGRLPDQTSFTASSFLVGTESADVAHLLFNSRLYRNQGAVAGLPLFRTQPQSDLSATLTWSKPETSTGAQPSALSVNVGLWGSRYQPSIRNSPVLPFRSGALQLSSTSWPAAVQASLVSTLPNRFRVLDDNPNRVTFSIQASTGLVTGSFIHPLQQRKRSFSGVIIQNALQPRVVGFFVSPTDAGSLIFQP